MNPDTNPNLKEQKPGQTAAEGPAPSSPVQAFPQFSDEQSSKKKIIVITICVIGFVIFLSLTAWGAFSVLFSMDKHESDATVSELQNNEPIEEKTPKLAVQTEAAKKPPAAKPAVENKPAAIEYPAELRDIYVDACSPGDQSYCHCEVDYFEKHLPVKDFSDAMKKSIQSEKYFKVFADALDACED